MNNEQNTVPIIKIGCHVLSFKSCLSCRLNRCFNYKLLFYLLPVKHVLCIIVPFNPIIHHHHHSLSLSLLFYTAK